MAMTETQHATLYNQLVDAIGREAARILMDQLPPSGWGQVATKDDIKASEEQLQRDLNASEKLLQGELKVAEGRLMVEIAASESRQRTRIDKTAARIDRANVHVS